MEFVVRVNRSMKTANIPCGVRQCSQGSAALVISNSVSTLRGKNTPALKPPHKHTQLIYKCNNQYNLILKIYYEIILTQSPKARSSSDTSHLPYKVRRVIQGNRV